MYINKTSTFPGRTPRKESNNPAKLKSPEHTSCLKSPKPTRYDMLYMIICIFSDVGTKHEATKATILYQVRSRKHQYI